MEIKKHTFVGCYQHPRFMIGCHHCLVDSVVKLCDVLENHPEEAEKDPSAKSNGLEEIFAGMTVTQFTDGWTTNVVALPVSEEDLKENVIRYVVEFRESKHDEV